MFAATVLIYLETRLNVNKMSVEATWVDVEPNPSKAKWNDPWIRHEVFKSGAV